MEEEGTRSEDSYHRHEPKDVAIHMTGLQYVGWAVHDLVRYADFKPLVSELPEFAAFAKPYDAVLVTNRIGRMFPFGAGVVFAFKVADDLSLTELLGELERLHRMVPTPGQLDLFEFYSGLVLVFEKPVLPALRDKLISIRRTSSFARCVSEIYVVEMDAGTMWTDQVPWLIRKYLDPLNAAIGRKGDAPPPPTPREPVVGQREKKTAIVFASVALTVVLAAVHLFVHLDDGAGSLVLRLFRFGANNTMMVAAGESWRLVTANFLHFGWGHLIGNCIGLFEYARGIEVLFGGGWVFALFIITGIGGTLLSNVFQPTACGAGASGAVFGLAGVLVGVYLFRRDQLSVRFRGHFWGSVLLVSAYQLYMGFRYGENIGNWAHLGGFLTGLAAGVVLPFKRGPRSPWMGGLWGLVAIAVSVAAAFSATRKFSVPPENYTSVSDTALRTKYEYPEGWTHDRVDGKRRVEISNHLGGEVSLEHVSDRIDGIFDMHDYEIQNQLEERYRKMYRGSMAGKYAMENMEIIDFGVSMTSFGGGKAISVRFRSRINVTQHWMLLFPVSEKREFIHEDLLLPHDQGYTVAQFEMPAGDEAYYRPVFLRIRNAVFSMAKPVEKVDPSRE